MQRGSRLKRIWRASDMLQIVCLIGMLLIAGSMPEKENKDV